MKKKKRGFFPYSPGIFEHMKHKNNHRNDAKEEKTQGFSRSQQSKGSSLLLLLHPRDTDWI